MKETYPIDNFTSALISTKTTIKKEYDWFAPLIGDWNFEYTDGCRKVEGEWFFQRILDGKGIQDIFICPSRSSRESNPQPDGEYGISVRVFNEKELCYDVLYTCGRYSKNLKFKIENGILTGTLNDNPAEKWRFTEIRENSFTWQNITITEEEEIHLNCEVKASRI